MTLSDLFKRLDWSGVDAGHRQWEADHDEAIRLDPDAVHQHRLERVYNAIDALQNDGDERHWWALPSTIRQQIADYYSQMGLLGDTQ